MPLLGFLIWILLFGGYRPRLTSRRSSLLTIWRCAVHGFKVSEPRVSRVQGLGFRYSGFRWVQEVSPSPSLCYMYLYTHTHTHIYIYIYIIHVFPQGPNVGSLNLACVCVCSQANSQVLGLRIGSNTAMWGRFGNA